KTRRGGFAVKSKKPITRLLANPCPAVGRMWDRIVSKSFGSTLAPQSWQTIGFSTLQPDQTISAVKLLNDPTVHSLDLATAKQQWRLRGQSAHCFGFGDRANLCLTVFLLIVGGRHVKRNPR